MITLFHVITGILNVTGTKPFLWNSTTHWLSLIEISASCFAVVLTFVPKCLTPLILHSHTHAHIIPKRDTLRKNISLFLSVGEWMVAGVPEGRGVGGLFLQEPHVLGLNSDCWVSVNIAPFWQQPPVPHQNPVTCAFPDKVLLVFPRKLKESRHFFSLQQAELWEPSCTFHSSSYKFPILINTFMGSHKPSITSRFYTTA